MTTRPGSGRWYPSATQFKDSAATEQAFRRLLDMHYDLMESHTVLREQMAAPDAAAGKPSSGSPPGSGPTDSRILGLPVAPVDIQTLADGATLKFSKKGGNFSFS